MCSPAEAQHLATYKVTVRYMFENPTTSAHTQHVRFYSTLLSRRIECTRMFTVPGFIPAPAPPSAAPVHVHWAWEEATHRHYKVGQQVEVTEAFKPKYQDFVGSVAVIRKIFAKKMGPDLYREYTFFLEVQGSDADETERLRNEVKRHNYKSFNFLRGDARSLLPCRQTHMRFFSQMRYDIANSNGGAKRAADDAGQGDAKKSRLEQQDAPPAQIDIKLGDAVEILNTLYILKEFVGFHGLVRRIERRESFTACWVEIQCNHAGQAVDPAGVVRKKNKSFYAEQEMWLSWVCCRADNVVLADPHVPDPWTPEGWAALPVKDRKMHRQKQKDDQGGKTSPKLHLKLAPEAQDIAVGDTVEIRQIVCKDWYPEQFVGFRGVVRSIQKHPFHTTCFVELTHTQAGVPVTPEHTRTIEDWNKGMYAPDERSFMKCNMDYIVRADPKLPSDSAPPPASHRDRPRHSKYDPAAKAPWHGGEVRPFLYGRKITFILSGRRGDPIAR